MRHLPRWRQRAGAAALVTLRLGCPAAKAPTDSKVPTATTAPGTYPAAEGFDQAFIDDIIRRVRDLRSM